MQRLAIVIISIFMLGCKKEGLKVEYKNVFNSSSQKMGKSFVNKSLQDDENEYYTYFGDYVGSLSPFSVTATFNTIRFIDRKISDPGMQTLLEIVSVNWPFEDERRFADFSKGTEVIVNPTIYGNVDNDGWFADRNVNLKYLAIIPQSLNFSFQLPVELDGISILLEFNERTENTVKCNMHQLLRYVKEGYIDYEHGIMLSGFVFGETDSSYITNVDNMAEGDVYEFINMVYPSCVARSANFTSTTLTTPENRQIKTITTIISFDTKDIIHQYAGFDNVPNTGDDYFVLKPKFWDRFKIVIEQN